MRPSLPGAGGGEREQATEARGQEEEGSRKKMVLSLDFWSFSVFLEGCGFRVLKLG